MREISASFNAARIHFAGHAIYTMRVTCMRRTVKVTKTHRVLQEFQSVSLDSQLYPCHVNMINSLPDYVPTFPAENAILSFTTPRDQCSGLVYINGQNTSVITLQNNMPPHL